MAARDKSEAPNPDRRAFFREGVRELFRPLAALIDTGEPDPPPATIPPPPAVWLRPPGAITESAFVDTCERCGNCAVACPVQAIRPYRGDDEKLKGTPIIDANAQACVACAEVACTQSCPSGALQRLTDATQIRMGIAIVSHGVCVRSHGEACTICVDTCPIGADAIDVSDKGRIRIHERGCVGCGVCQMYCPTSPKAVTVVPRPG